MNEQLLREDLIEAILLVQSTPVENCPEVALQLETRGVFLAAKRFVEPTEFNPETATIQDCITFLRIGIQNLMFELNAARTERDMYIRLCKWYGGNG